MKVVLSIRTGRLSTTLLLRRLGTESRRNNIYEHSEELGRLIRRSRCWFPSEPEPREE